MFPSRASVVLVFFASLSLRSCGMVSPLRRLLSSDTSRSSIQSRLLGLYVTTEEVVDSTRELHQEYVSTCTWHSTLWKSFMKTQQCFHVKNEEHFVTVHQFQPFVYVTLPSSDQENILRYPFFHKVPSFCTHLRFFRTAPCAPNPCMYGGICNEVYNVTSGSPTSCICPTGFSGPYCEKST